MIERHDDRRRSWRNAKLHIHTPGGHQHHNQWVIASGARSAAGLPKVRGSSGAESRDIGHRVCGQSTLIASVDTRAAAIATQIAAGASCGARTTDSLGSGVAATPPMQAGPHRREPPSRRRATRPRERRRRSGAGPGRRATGSRGPRCRTGSRRRRRSYARGKESEGARERRAGCLRSRRAPPHTRARRSQGLVHAQCVRRPPH